MQCSKKSKSSAASQLDREIAQALARRSNHVVPKPRSVPRVVASAQSIVPNKKDPTFVDWRALRALSPAMRESALGITPEIKSALLNHERKLGGPVVTAGLATRVLNAIHNYGGVAHLRTLPKRDLLRLKNVGRSTVDAMIELGLSSDNSEKLIQQEIDNHEARLVQLKAELAARKK